MNGIAQLPELAKCVPRPLPKSGDSYRATASYRIFLYDNSIYFYIHDGFKLRLICLTSFPRPRSKRVVAYAVVNAGSNFASIYASYFYPSSQGTQYRQTDVANVAFCGVCISLATLLHFTLRRQNRKPDEAGAAVIGAGRNLSDEGWECF